MRLWCWALLADMALGSGPEYTHLLTPGGLYRLRHRKLEIEKSSPLVNDWPI